MVHVIQQLNVVLEVESLVDRVPVDLAFVALVRSSLYSSNYFVKMVSVLFSFLHLWTNDLPKQLILFKFKLSVKLRCNRILSTDSEQSI